MLCIAWTLKLSSEGAVAHILVLHCMIQYGVVRTSWPRSLPALQMPTFSHFQSSKSWLSLVPRARRNRRRKGKIGEGKRRSGQFMWIRDERKHLSDCYDIISAMMSTLLGMIDTADSSGMQLSLPFPSALGSSRIPQKCRIPAQRPLRGDTAFLRNSTWTKSRGER